MKMRICLLALFCFCFQIQADSRMEAIYAEGARIAREVEGRGEEKTRLVDFYENEIAQLDLETLQKNPELVFRKAFARIDNFFTVSSPYEARAYIESLYKDFSFIVEFAPKESRYGRAAQFQSNLCRRWLDSGFQNWEEFTACFDSFAEDVLRQWASNQSASGKALRQDVYENLLSSKEAFDSFAQFAMIANEDVEFLLSNIKPDKVEVLGVSEGDLQSCLRFKFDYSRSRCLRYSYEMEI